MGKWDLLWWDDLILSIGYVFAVVHWGFLFSALRSGLAVTVLAMTADQTAHASEVSIPFTYRAQDPGHPKNGRDSGLNLWALANMITALLRREDTTVPGSLPVEAIDPYVHASNLRRRHIQVCKTGEAER